MPSNISADTWCEQENVARTPAGVGGDPEPVFELVEIEAGLVTLPECHADPDPAFLDDDMVRAVLVEPGARWFEAFEGSLAGVVSREHRHIADDLTQPDGDVTSAPRHPEGEALNDGDGAVAVHHQPRQGIGLAPDEPGQAWRRSALGPPCDGHRDAPA